MDLSIPQKIAIWILPLIFALGFREALHGYVAYYLGDPSAKLHGRLSLNPLKHLDLLGSIIIPLGLLAYGNFLFGWGKPIPIDARYFKHPRRDLALIAAGGLFSNVLMAFVWGGIGFLALLFLGLDYPWASVPLLYMSKIGILINVALAVLNCLPLPPLDGGKILIAVLPQKIALEFSKIEPYSFFILLFLILTGLLTPIIFDPIQNISDQIAALFYLR